MVLNVIPQNTYTHTNAQILPTLELFQSHQQNIYKEKLEPLVAIVFVIILICNHGVRLQTQPSSEMSSNYLSSLLGILANRDR